MKERILEFLRLENKTSSQFAEEIGVQPSSISHILSGRNKPSLDFVIKMLEAYSDLSTDWLIFGRGSMYGGENINTGVEGISDKAVSGDLFNDIEITRDTGYKKDEESPDMDIGKQQEVRPGAAAMLSKVILLYTDGTFSEYRK